VRPIGAIKWLRFDQESKLRINPKVSLSAVVGVIFLVVVLAQPPVSASEPTSPSSLAHDLVPASYLQHQGFTKVIEKTTTTSKTGEKSCPNGAREIYEDASGQGSGVEAEIVACTTNKAAAALLSAANATPSGSSLAAPKHQLGSSAVERNEGGSSPSYLIYWQRGSLLALVVLTTDISASSASTTTSTTVAAPPITPTQQKTLVSVAVQENNRL
jgi:hypothetical protein